jgi:protein O-mannosyl-transferase
MTNKPRTARSRVGDYFRGMTFRRDLLLTALTLAALGSACNHDLLNFDDDKYVQHFSVENGLTLENMAWAFETFHASNWHPLTWLSLQGDADWVGPSPRIFHLTNLLLHLANVLLLAEVLRRMTGRYWGSAAVAALFAVHPLHVESVAWVTERKDVLSTFFGLLAIAAYVRYARQPSWKRALPVVAAFAASLLSKAMFVTLPCLLLLLDYWPLRRLAWGQRPSCSSRPALPQVRLLWLILEKLPLLAMSAGLSAMTMRAQQSGGSVKSLERFPMELRVHNAIWETLCYLGQTFWPVDLAAYYPYPVGGIPMGQVALAASLLAFITFVACWLARSRPYLLVGWFWFLGMLVPVIGLVQVGSQARADRYTYVPLIGVFIMLVWVLIDLATDQIRKAAVGTALVAAIVCCAWVTRIQAGYWANSAALWEHTIAVTKDNAFAVAKYGETMRQEGRIEAALGCFREAIRLNPRMDPAFAAMGEIYRSLDQWDAAEECFRRAAAIRPDIRRYRVLIENIPRERAAMKNHHGR